MPRLMGMWSLTGISDMVAVVGDPAANRVSARLYHSLGFEDVGLFRGVGEKFGKKLDATMLPTSSSGISEGPPD